MSRKPRQKSVVLEDIYPKKPKVEEFSFVYKPRNPSQVEADELWKRSRIQFLIGEAGCGKTAAALGMALREVFKTEKGKLFLSRPTVACDEDLGFEPGDLNAKLGSWMGPFRDVFSSLSVLEWADLEKRMADRLELIPVGRLRGRTIRNGVLIIDEAQNLTYAQLKCAVTRIGTGGRIILCGDPDQSDKFDSDRSPLMRIADSLESIDTISVIEFDSVEDQLRDPLVSLILPRLD